MTIFAVALAMSAAALTVVVNRDAAPPRVTASSGSDPVELIANTTRNAVWHTDDETVGAWVELAYPEPTAVNHVVLRGPGKEHTGVKSALLTFDGAASLLVTADASGDASVSFPERTVSRVRMTVAGVPSGATSVSLAGLSFHASGRDPSGGGDGPVVAEASSQGGSSAAALSDGSPRKGDTGQEWVPSNGDMHPWAQLSWDQPRQVASVQIFGPSGEGVEGEAPLGGLLQFDDGSSVRVSAIASGGGEATTIAFAPRMATAVRLEMDTRAGLRELVIHDVGTTPPRWKQSGASYATAPPEPDPCLTATEPVGVPGPGKLGLVCPAPGTLVENDATVVVSAEPGTAVEAAFWTGQPVPAASAFEVAAVAVANEEGRAHLAVDTGLAPSGPLTLRVDTAAGAWGSVVDGGTAPLYVQLYKRIGEPPPVPETVPGGMTLQWAEEFTDGLSVSSTGLEADYAAVKPDASSNGQFGEAPFVESTAGTLTTLDRQYLRIRTQPADTGSSRDGTANVAGLLASVDVDGAGFAAQYGYFEARILGAPGAGSWPAFWMLNTESAARPSKTAAEVDAVELYGHDTMTTCHTVHNWGAELAGEAESSEPSCLTPENFSDWAMSWHTYGVRIGPDSAVFTIDGQVVSTAERLHLTEEPFFFLIDLALGGGWPIDLSPTGGVTDMYVDWVRVYT